MTGLAFVSLLLLTTMVSTASAQGGIASCCRRISNTQIHREMLRSYYVQRRPACHLHAVVFTKLNGGTICAEPSKLWTQTSMAFLDGKNWSRQRFILQRQHH
ncbi:monocyte chemotactic protein 1B-like [Trachinotus anak]|uniref:monocyte chemotactic protein 1B-like n=1 Tax=Trachinotus anak TaxID=443729 RepID=UPI0039F17CD1